MTMRFLAPVLCCLALVFGMTGCSSQPVTSTAVPTVTKADAGVRSQPQPQAQPQPQKSEGGFFSSVGNLLCIGGAVVAFALALFSGMRHEWLGDKLGLQAGTGWDRACVLILFAVGFGLTRAALGWWGYLIAGGLYLLTLESVRKRLSSLGSK